MFASEDGQIDVTKYLVENCADINIKNKYGATASALASSSGHLEIIKYLIEKMDYHNDWDNLLMWAAYGGSIDIVKYLVENGALVNAKDNQTTPLISSSEEGHLEV